jgi:hypothetical protein
MATGRAAFERGDFDRAIESWSLAAIASERTGDRAGQIQALVYARGIRRARRYRQAVGLIAR